MIVTVALLAGFACGVFFALGLLLPWLMDRKANHLRDASVLTFKKEPMSFRCGYARALDDMTEGLRKEDA